LLFGKEEALSWNKDELARMMMLGIARKQQKWGGLNKENKRIKS
jgi:hypothetical protein